MRRITSLLALGQELHHPQWVIVLSVRSQGVLQHERIRREASLMLGSTRSWRRYRPRPRRGPPGCRRGDHAKRCGTSRLVIVRADSVLCRRPGCADIDGGGACRSGRFLPFAVRYRMPDVDAAAIRQAEPGPPPRPLQPGCTNRATPRGTQSPECGSTPGTATPRSILCRCS